MNENILSLLCTLIKTGKLAESREDRMLDSVGLTVTKMLALEQLHRTDEPLSLGDLATRLHFVKSNATQLVDNLEAARLVRRVPHHNDRRCTLLQLTDEGRNQHNAAMDSVQPLVDQVESLYTPEELAQLTHLLQRLNDALG